MILTGKALRNYIIRHYRGKDVNAVLAIISVEGGFYGAVGDHGTSFGPFQLHVGGAMPKGLSGARARAWAQSEAGINYALRHVEGVAGQLQGYAAVHAIAYSFERPADPANEVRKAMAAYGGPIPAGSPAGAGGGGAGAPPSPVSAPITGGSQSTLGPSASDQGTLQTAESSQPMILSPGAVPSSSSGPQRAPDSWQLLMSQPLVDAETQALYNRRQAAGG